MPARELAFAAALVLVAAPLHGVQDAPAVDDLRVGQWVEVRGEAAEDGTFTASAVVVLAPGEQEVLLGTVQQLTTDGFVLLGQPVEVSEKTDWHKLDPERIAGERVKVEGYWRGPRKLSARSVALRDLGRDRIEGRIDAVAAAPGGVWLEVMRYRVFVPREQVIVAELPLDEIELKEARRTADGRVEDDDDQVPLGYELLPNLWFGARLESESQFEREFDLNPRRERDRDDSMWALRGELAWLPETNFSALFNFRTRYGYRDDDGDGVLRGESTRVSELYGYWSEAAGFEGLGVQFGRQDFDEPREWIYDQNLDALRVVVEGAGLVAELSASTTLSDGGPREEATDNYIAYVSNGDYDRHLAAWVVDRRDSREPRDLPLFAGVRALGEWLPGHELWAELSVVRGYSGQTTDLVGYGLDLGTSWSPELIDPFYLIGGFAFGSGDANTSDGDDGNFRQTGLQDNNARFGGVTSYRYYGELFDPELSNLSILTLGLGRRFRGRNSLDLVWHGYRQDVAVDFLRDTQLDARPDGVHKDLGWEADLVLGSRASSSLDVELVLSHFQAGDAFPNSEDAWLGRIQLRVKF